MRKAVVQLRERTGSPVTITVGAMAKLWVMGHADCVQLCVIGCV